VHRRTRRGSPRFLDPRASLRLLQLASFTSSFDRFLIAPLILVVAVDLGESVAAVTLVATVYYQAYGLMQAPWAVVSDRLGRIRTIRLTLALAAVAGVAAAAAPGLGWLLAARAVAGASFAAAAPGAMMYVGDTVPVRERQVPLTELMTGGALGIALATAGAGLMGDHLHWRVAFAGPAVAAGVLAVRMRRVPEPEDLVTMPVGRSLLAVVGNRWAQAVLLLVFLEGLILLGLLTFLPLSLQSDGYSASVAGLITGVYGVALLVFARLVRRLVPRVAPAVLVAVGAASGCIAYLVLLVDDGPAGVVVASACVGGAWAFMHSTLQTWATSVVPEARATAVSLFASLLFTGGAVASAVGAGYVEDGRFHELTLGGLGAMVALAVAATVARARYARHPAE
jgi:MFS transporter, YNFM family, putative membrane transport protein